MGTGCSKSVVVVSSSTWKPEARNSRSSASNTSTTNCSGSTIKTLAEAAIWSPFKLSRSEAEELLSRAEPGAFVFSHDVTSELFLSISAGKYVCHHAVLTRDQGYYVGARRFTTIGDVVDYFTDHPLGETTLKQGCKGLPRSTSHVQIRQHPDISIPCPANITTNGRYAGQHENGQRVSTVQSSVCTKISQSQSPKITLTSHPSAEDKTITEDDGHVLVSIDTDEQQTAPKQNPRFDSLTKKQLTRSMAIDRADSSGEFQETALSPLLPARSSAVK
ncbi:hypothetical protein OS493_014037 [Desmophyllum pertusum]|uniref:SH2 domain-containing protein n=1 Tax=Desmophyllum pertusum TaxID=174260 RepID=A0A9W9ZDR0_9CNID|nr:hypothetical protein OS493_014037 [Desmophyllum pertusum]